MCLKQNESLSQFPIVLRKSNISRNRIRKYYLEQTYFQSTSLFIKIKITDTGLFTIAPGKGFINPREKINLQIKLNKITNFDAKLLVSSAKIDHDQRQSFES